MVLEPIEVFVAFSAYLTSVRLVLFHTQGPWIGAECFWVDNRKSAVVVCLKLLRVVSML